MSELSDALRAQRIEFAGEVHDRIIPPLFAARMQLEALAARWESVTGERGAMPEGLTGPASPGGSQIQQAVDLIVLAISTSRQLLSELTPQEPGEKHWDSQLRQALGDRAIELRQIGNLPWDQIDPDSAITITSIAAEAIRNAVRHGQPSGIEITIEQLDPTTLDAQGSDPGVMPAIRIAITDNGRGFDPTLPTRHHGLHLMRLRAAAIGGSLEISSQVGGPTTVTLRWPHSAHEPGRAGNHSTA